MPVKSAPSRVDSGRFKALKFSPTPPYKISPSPLHFPHHPAPDWAARPKKLHVNIRTPATVLARFRRQNVTTTTLFGTLRFISTVRIFGSPQGIFPHSKSSGPPSSTTPPSPSVPSNLSRKSASAPSTPSFPPRLPAYRIPLPHHQEPPEHRHRPVPSPR
jgi:hypothetical protein